MRSMETGAMSAKVVRQVEKSTLSAHQMHRAEVGRTSSLIGQTRPVGTYTVVASVREVIHTVS